MPRPYSKRKQKQDANLMSAKASVLQNKEKPQAKVNSPKAETPKVKKADSIMQKKRDAKRIAMKKRRAAAQSGGKYGMKKGRLNPAGLDEARERREKIEARKRSGMSPGKYRSPKSGY